MFKSNLSSNSMLPSKKRPVLFKETADDTPPSTPVPKDAFINPANSNTFESASNGTRTDFERKIGAIPSSVNERFQWYLENNKNQEDKTTRSNNIILDSLHNIKYSSMLPKAPGQTKQNSNNGATNGNKPASSVDLLARPWQQGQPDAKGVPANASSSTNDIPDEHAELAAIVEKLPDDFDVEKWENMTALQQQNALKNSGLTGEEQMKLLNAPTSIKTIAIIQNIQANRAQYGITQARDNEISSELLKIANARIGVINHALPFASNLQRNLFLEQLDKEEQKLLESVDGQKEINNDMISKDTSISDFSRHKFPNRRVVVREIAPLSMVAQFAKDLLKAYVEIQFILPSALELFPIQEFGELIDEGTVSVGMTGNASVFYIAGAKGSMGLAMDSIGDIGALRTRGAYLGVPNAAVTVFASLSNADSLRDLEGKSIEYGGSIGEILTFGGDIAFFTDEAGKKKFAVDVALGMGVSQLPVEGHVGVTETLSFEDQTGEDESLKIYNIFDAWEKYVREFLEW